MFSSIKKIHFVGIGGIGMSGIAEILLDQGFKVAGLMCIGLFVGAYFGGYLANQVSSDSLRKIFGVVLLLISLKMIFGK